MSNLYEVVFSQVAVTAAQDLFELAIPATHKLKFHHLEVSQSSDAQDAEDEQLHITIKRITGSPTSGSGGSAFTPLKLDPDSPAASFTAEINNTTQLSGGTVDFQYPVGWNNRGGWVYTPTPELRFKATISTYIVVSLDAAPADSLTMSGVLFVEEL